VWALRRRSDNAVDRWDGHTYRRVLALDSRAIELAAVQTGSPALPTLAVTLAGPRLDDDAEHAVRAVLPRLLGLEIDLRPFYRHARRDPFLGVLSARFRGLKPPRLPTMFECIVNAIACQQLTVTLGIRLLNRLAETYGAALHDGGGHAFPRAADLAGLPPETLRPLGFSRTKSRSIIELAAAIDTGELDLEALETLDDEAVVSTLLRLRGVGRWTAEYALLRGLGRLHVFPGDDVGARNTIARRLSPGGRLDYAGIQAAVRPWQPFAGFVYFHLLLANLAERGIVAETATPIV
jgi:DNA-3-methyladenine glycosylase II